MSQLIMIGQDGSEHKLNVTQFESVMSAQIDSVQTASILQHFPIRCGQPDIQFTVQFRGRAEHIAFQDFVLKHQRTSRVREGDGCVTLWWPQRNIENWTGFITEWRAVHRKGVYAPKVTFGVSLMDSLMSEKTTISSFASNWRSIWGPQVSSYHDRDSWYEDAVAPDDMLQQPSQPSYQNTPPPEFR